MIASNCHEVMTPLNRPTLREIPLSAVTLERGHVIVTMSPGQWDALLASAYAQGFTLLELDANERPTRAYRLCTCGLCVPSSSNNN
jgi:hypothetical protein